MALSRFALKKLNQRVLTFTPSSSSLVGREVEANRHFSSEGQTMEKKVGNDESSSEAKEVISTSSKEPKRSKSLFSWKPFKRGLIRSRNNDRHFAPSLFEMIPSGLENALMEMNKVLENLNVNPSSHIPMRVKEKNDCYMLRFDVPGLRKEDLKVSVEDGVLVINGEAMSKEEEEEEENDTSYYSRMYGYYHTSLALPEDAKVDEIRAELNDGVLRVVVPRDQDKPKKKVNHVEIH